MEKLINCEPFAIPGHWPRTYALDLDWQRVSVIWAATDPDSQTVYLYGEYTARRVELAIHTDAIRSRGKDLRGYMYATSNGRTGEEGAQLIDELWKRDLLVRASPHAHEVSLGELANLLAGRRLRVFNTLLGWTSEYPLYRRDEKGKPNDAGCPLIGCTVLLAPIAPGLSPEDEDDEDEGLGRGRSVVTGY